MTTTKRDAGPGSTNWAGVSSPSISDALGRLCGHKACVLDFMSPTPGRVLFGPAVTIRFVPFRQDLYDATKHSFARFFYEAIGKKPAGKVLVLDSNGHGEISIGGGTKFSRLQNHNLAGLVTDGRLRDFSELASYVPVFYCRGETMRAGTGDLMPISADEPVSLVGVTVIPGDFVFADSAGAVIIPAGLCEQVLNDARDIEAADTRFVEEIRNEDPDKVRQIGSGEN